jgi:hypothetical protein
MDFWKGFRMRLFTLAAMAVSAAAFGLGAAARPAIASNPQKLSGPFVHDNLTLYFIHGSSTPGPVPLTLAEALAKGTVKVIETGSVNNLEIENTADTDVFIQAGDIVKGGQQDRVLMMSMVLPGKSGKVPIGSFCVEQGRWSKRGTEDVKNFASATEYLPSREAKLAMKAPAKAAPPPASTDAAGRPQRQVQAGRDDTGKRQSEVWSAVSDVQAKLSARLGAPVAAAQSASSLQLSLENERLKATRAAYITSLGDKAQADDIVGYVFAINGKINSADQYPSNGLFKKMWPKLLAASATEALGEVRRTASTSSDPAPAASMPVTSADVEGFLTRAEAGKAEEKPLGKLARQEMRDNDKSLYVEARKADGTWVHKNYLAK